MSILMSTYEVLLKVEWNGPGQNSVNQGVCPCCEFSKPSGHSPTCELKALLDKLK